MAAGCPRPPRRPRSPRPTAAGRGGCPGAGDPGQDRLDPAPARGLDHRLGGLVLEQRLERLDRREDERRARRRVRVQRRPRREPAGVGDLDRRRARRCAWGWARATKKWVSKRTGTTSGVIQRDQATSSASARSSIPASSASSRGRALLPASSSAARSIAAREDPDPGHERRLGRAPDQQHLDPGSDVLARLGAADQDRCRGPRGRRCSRSSRRTITCAAVTTETTQAALHLHLVRVHLRPRRGRSRRRHPAGHGLRRHPRHLVLPGLRRPQGRLRALRRARPAHAASWNQSSSSSQPPSGHANNSKSAGAAPDGSGVMCPSSANNSRSAGDPHSRSEVVPDQSSAWSRERLRAADHGHAHEGRHQRQRQEDREADQRHAGRSPRAPGRRRRARRRGSSRRRRGRAVGGHRDADGREAALALDPVERASAGRRRLACSDCDPRLRSGAARAVSARISSILALRI